MNTSKHLLACLMPIKDAVGPPLFDFNPDQGVPFVLLTQVASDPTPVLGNVAGQDMTSLWRIDSWSKTPAQRDQADATIRAALISPPSVAGSSRLLAVSSKSHLSEENIDTQIGVAGADTAYRVIRSYTLQEF